MELIYVAAAIMMGLANALRARRGNPSWRQSGRARSFWERVW